MVLGLSLRVSWICLLLFSSGACFPATQGDYKYGSDPGSNLQSEGSSRPLHLSSGSPVTYDAHIPIVPYSGAASGDGFAAGSSQPLVGHGSSPTGSLSPSSMAVGSSASHQPSGSHVTYDSHIPIVPYSGAASGGGFAAGSNLPSEGSFRPLAVGSSASHQPSGSHVTYDAHIPIVPYSGVGYSSSPAAGSSPMSGVSSSFAYLAGNAGHPSRNTAAGAHGGHFSYGSSPMYGSSGYAYPSRNAGQPSRNTAAGFNALPYRSPVSGSAHPWDPRHEGAVASPGFATDGAASDLNAWIEARPFIDLSFLESAEGMLLSGSQKTSPPMPSSYIIQSRNGYVRDREAFSHKTYSPEYPEPPVMRAKGMSAPGIVSKGGKKV